MKIAVIPARGGSKRIPRKNIKNFLGKPIIAYSIETAITSGIFDKVIVSTDDDEIVQVAKKYGAEVPFIRPKTLADDYTGTNDVVKHTINQLIEEGVDIDYVCCIYATTPLLEARFLKEGFEKLKNTGKAFVFSVTSFPSPIQRAIKIKDGKVSMFFPEHSMTRSQDLEEAYHDAGQFYWGKASSFLNDQELFSSRSYAVVLPRDLVQDIDSMEDWRKTELMYEAIQQKKDIK